MSPVEPDQVFVPRVHFSPVIDRIFAELNKAEKKFPGWPMDPVHGAAILGEEAGEALQAALDYYYGRAISLDKLKKEVAQTGAMAIRMLLFLENYESGVHHVPILTNDEGGEEECPGP